MAKKKDNETKVALDELRKTVGLSLEEDGSMEDTLGLEEDVSKSDAGLDLEEDEEITELVRNSQSDNELLEIGPNEDSGPSVYGEFPLAIGHTHPQGEPDEEYLKFISDIAERGDRSRDKHGFMSGVTPVTYRYEFKFKDPIQSFKKVPGVTKDGTNKIEELTLFGCDPNTFFFLHAAFSRLGIEFARSEAVILDSESVVTWRDRNKGEME